MLGLLPPGPPANQGLQLLEAQGMGPGVAGIAQAAALPGHLVLVEPHQVGGPASMEEQQVGLFDIGGVHITGLEESLASEMLSDVSVYDMAIVFRSLIRELPPEPTFIIEEIPYSIEGQMAYILSFFENTKKVLFARLAGSLDSRLAVIMTFLAMLELMRLGKVSIRQPHPFGEFWLLMRVKYEAA